MSEKHLTLLSVRRWCYLSHTVTVTNGNLAQVGRKLNTVAKYIMLATIRQRIWLKFVFYSHL